MEKFDNVFKLLKIRGPMHLQIIEQTGSNFNLIHNKLKLMHDELKKKLEKIDPRIPLKVESDSEFEVNLTISDDLLVFVHHTNVFTFESSHSLWKTSYVAENPLRAHCGMISIYNFLNDSFKYQRTNDIGILVGRIFINAENHFFIEGKGQLGFLYNDFANSILTEDVICNLLETVIIGCLQEDLFVPPIEQVYRVSMQELDANSLSSSISTGKRLGFKFQNEQNKPE
ncbi:MAG TPA: hypothetical protein PKH65_00750 [Bacteroidia bacterium]|nr:hypothetical protein [Bacteroidia bacterium]HNT79180.1 hypothetical protein [Bacteroidia bacterium]